MAGRGAGIRIRPWAMDDADALHRLVQASRAGLSPWLAWCRDGYARADADAWIAHSTQAWAARSAFPFAVVDQDDGTLVGGAGLDQLDPARRGANLGYWTGSAFTGRGIAREAARQAARFGFDEIGLQRIEIRVLPGNTGSLKVAEALGATREGIARHGLVDGGTPRDAVLFSLIPADLA